MTTPTKRVAIVTGASGGIGAAVGNIHGQKSN
jgi:NADP-dependent 3-hydroxy acid dehydrogenase YdfG